MKAGVTASVIAHAALLIIAIVGLGSARPLEPEIVESIAVDLVPISDITNIRQGSLDSTVVETDTPAVVEDTKPAELAQPTGNTQEDQVTPEETNKATPAPVVNTAPEPVPQPTPEPVPVPEPTPEPEPVAAPDPAPAPVETQPQQEVATEVAEAPAVNVAPMPAMRPAALQKAPAKVDKPKDVKTAEVTPKKQDTPKKQPQQATKQQDQQAKEADQVAALINSEKSRGATTGSGGTPTLGKNTGRSATLTQSQLDGLVAQIKGCMNVPAGAAEAGITTQLHFVLDAGGNVVGTPDVVSGASSTLERALASAAQRAVVRCGPYAMAVSQEVKATFDPRELL